MWSPERRLSFAGPLGDPPSVADNDLPYCPTTTYSYHPLSPSSACISKQTKQTESSNAFENRGSTISGDSSFKHHSPLSLLYVHHMSLQTTSSIPAHTLCASSPFCWPPTACRHKQAKATKLPITIWNGGPAISGDGSSIHHLPFCLLHAHHMSLEATAPIHGFWVSPQYLSPPSACRHK